MKNGFLRRKLGFTLIELIVVVVIVGVVALILLSVVGGVTGLGGKWCDGCGHYFWLGEATAIKVPNSRDLKLCPKHYTRYITYQNATRGQVNPPPFQLDDGR